MAENNIRSWLREMAKGTKEQREPVLIGEGYVDTKRLIQQYEEELKYHDAKLKEAQADLDKCKDEGRRSVIVGDGFTVKGYGLLIPLRDDLDVVKELNTISECMRKEYGLSSYFTDPKSVGRFVLYPYPVKELAVFFPEFLTYNLVDEIEKLKRSVDAAYRVQVHQKAKASIEDYIRMEENAATILGNRELAERLKESDTTLMLSLAAGTQADSNDAPGFRQEAEPEPEEVKAALNDLAYRDLEIRTPSTLDTPPPEFQETKLTGVDVVNKRKPKKKIKQAEKRMKGPKAKPKEPASA